MKTLKRLLLTICFLIGTLGMSQAQESFTYNGHTYTMEGNLSIDKYNSKATGKVTFTHIPSDYDEFEYVYQILGETPYGAAAMMPMAMEMYARDSKVGEQCIKLINAENNVSSVMSIVSQKLKNVGEGDSYRQRYLPAAVLEGATPENGYNPKKPYTINMKASANKHQEMQLYDGTVMYIYIMGKGWDTEQRSIEIVKTSDSELFKVFNCPSLYVQCKRIKGKWNGLD